MRVAVIGSGISGIATAYFLRQKNIDVDLYESEGRIGGRIGSEQLLARRVDFGGKNIGRQYTLFREFVRACGNPELEYFGLNTSQIVNGRVVKINREGSKLFNLLRIFSLCGFEGVWRLDPQVRTILNDRSQGVIGSDYFIKISERYDHMTLANYLTRRCVNNLVRPITIRMNGAEPDECFPGNFGSNLALVLDSYDQLKHGMHGLLDSFRVMTAPGSLRVFESHRVTSVSAGSGSEQVMLGYVHRGVTGSAAYDRVVSAIPALRLAVLFDEQQPSVSALLRQIRYYPVAVAIVRYRRQVFKSDCRAMMFDNSVALSNAGAYGINDLDLVRYTFSGRVSRSTVSEFSAPEAVVGLGEEITAPFFNIRGNPREAFVYRYLPEGLCAYSSRHHLLLKNIDQELRKIPGFAATGDYRRGASIEACFRAAGECVEKLTGG
ncbi:MAG: NAD(P)-binding protein [Chlorobiaceae bacterium]|nr:NAD(P)-binding protein [Chlorobiaceae bacterium]NTW74940.1 NAD(P)-binding protein [Chlorobiaceae bacterium]